MNLSKFQEIYNQFDKIDITAKFDLFNDLYSINILKALSDEELVIRLFGNAGTNPRGLFNWIEHGREPTRCKCGGESGAQMGILYYDENNINLNIYSLGSSSRKPICQKLNITEAKQYAKNVLTALSVTCQIIENSVLETKEDYEEAYNKICDQLKKINRPKSRYWYWDENGRPGTFLLKYYYCSFPNKISPTYAPGSLEEVLIKLIDKTSISDMPFVMNGQLSIFARSVGADSINFEAFIASRGFYSDFARFCKENGVPNGGNAYKNGIKKIEKQFGVNILDEYHKDRCQKITADVANAGNKDWPSHLKKYIEYCDSLFASSTTMSANNDDTTINEEVTNELRYQKSYSNRVIKFKNVIFRGAPGTGKSYLAKQIAADIISGGAHTDYKCLTPEEKKQVEFVQFHPSYDYSDFVEGLRPIKEASGIGFELKDGSFKAFVNRARDNFENSRKTKSDIEKELSIDEKISDFLENSLGNQEFETLHGNKFTISSYDDQQIKIYIPNNEITHTLNIKVDDIKKLLVSEQEFKTVREIRRFFNKKHATQEHSYIYILYKHILESSYAFVQTPTVEIKEKPFVFIIDEINRGEISKIFGELFYSIEPSKRGRDGEITTQYANLHDDYEEKFYIPQNVYIIGTMNDIDRSVDSFDFAMRRRFKFIEITSEESQAMLDLGIADDTLRKEAKIRMNRLNEAIDNVPELNSNYHIGASYFMNIKGETDFKELWIDSLKPLLQEYIVGTYTEKATMVEFENAYFGEKTEEQAVKNVNDGVEDESDETNG